MGFWDIEHLDLADALNEKIWTESIAQQESIQPYRADWMDGEIGAQQAMRAPHKLRWVPDILGTHWRSAQSVVVVGSAYAPFIANEHGQHEMSPAAYDQPSAGAFMRQFVESVVQGRGYYAGVATLASHAALDASRLVLLDLCRVAFVQRGFPRDTGGDSVVNSAHELFARYVESSAPRRWLWERIITTQASGVVALGTVAEHGILRLFAAQLPDAHIVDSVDSSIAFAPGNRVTWPARHASRHRTLEKRSAASSVPFWQVSGTVAGVRRFWRVGVVPHPTGAFDKLGDYSARAIRAAMGWDASS